MQLKIDIVNAFTNEAFKGNSAAVIITENWLDDDLMQLIAIQNNLSETAFLVKDSDEAYNIRWFSPLREIDFCGHATLASAFLLFEKNSTIKTLKFSAAAVGVMSIIQTADGKIQMDFPNNKPTKINDIPTDLIKGLSIAPTEVYANNQAYVVVYDSEEKVLSVERDNDILKRLTPLDVAVTCQPKSSMYKDYDFISRYFWPANGGDEDPVTGSAHTGLAPLWAEKLGKHELVAYQASSRGGVLNCEVAADRVLISGNAVHYLSGFITV